MQPSYQVRLEEMMTIFVRATYTDCVSGGLAVPLTLISVGISGVAGNTV
jgi:hypothetical protein